MCTAVSWRSKDHYFGRNLDLEFVCNESVTVTPRNFPFQFRNTQPQNTHYAIIGMATMMDGYPLYFDAINECGLGVAALNFPVMIKPTDSSGAHGMNACYCAEDFDALYHLVILEVFLHYWLRI